jgi:hypothetical protein
MTNVQYILLTYEKKERDRQNFFSLDSLDVECEMGNCLSIIYECHNAAILFWRRQGYVTQAGRSLNIRFFFKITHPVKANMNNTSSHLWIFINNQWTYIQKQIHEKTYDR